jgi:dTDP-4-amino-4,6-dideoxygalactose transaminase
VVPVVDLSRRGARFAAAFAESAGRIARSGAFLLGDELAAFEADFATWLRVPSVVGVSSGAAALQLALAALDIGPGDEVVVPSFTAVPTASAVAAVGATPVVVDVDPATACVTAETIATGRTARTKAAIVVHLYGYPAPVPAIDGLAVIEDAAQAHGAISGTRTSAASAYSFYPTKNLGGIGDGGAVACADPAISARVRRLRAHGAEQQYVHVEVSQNFRMSEIEAAWLRLGLQGLDADLARRREIAAHYRAAAPQLRWQATDPAHAYHLCVFRSTTRDDVRADLAGRGVATAVHYPLAVHQQPAYTFFAHPPCRESERWAAECVSVPCFAEMTDAEVETVGAALATVSR